MENHKEMATVLKHQVRGILMNDLGLSRAVVLEMAQKIVEDAVTKKVEQIVSGASIEYIVNQAIDRKFNLKTMFQDEIKKQAATYIQDKLTVNIK